MMDRLLLSHIDEELVSSEVAALRFLCSDVLNRKRLETVQDGRGLFDRLLEKGLLENHHFLSQLLQTIGRYDLLRLLETDAGQPEQESRPQTDASPALSDYRRMLYRVSEDITLENLTKMKFLLSEKLGRGRLDHCSTPLEVLAEMERQDVLSERRLEELERMLQQCDQQLAKMIEHYREGGSLSREESFAQPIGTPHGSVDQSIPLSLQSVSLSETQSAGESAPCDAELQSVSMDAQASRVDQELQSVSMDAQASRVDQTDRYPMTRNPRGQCLVINNEHFDAPLNDRPGTKMDERSIRSVFSRLGFVVKVLNDLTRDAMLEAVDQLGRESHAQADALVVCVLSHGDVGCVYGVDGKLASVRSLARPFTSGRCPSLAQKPKLLFVQACQGRGYQKGALPAAAEEEEGRGAGGERARYEADAGPVVRSVPDDADFLIGMATVENFKSFRNTREGSIYIQELCRQLEVGGASGEDILSVLTRVNREVSRGEFLAYKQMPEPKYTLTKKLILTFL